MSYIYYVKSAGALISLFFNDTKNYRRELVRFVIIVIQINQVNHGTQVQSYIKYFRPLWSWKKFVNATKILSSYFLSRLTRKYLVWGKPYTFIVEPSALCNLRCPQCPVGLKTLTRPQSNMALDDYRQVIDQISDYTWWLLLYFQGESFINPAIIDMVNYAYQKKIFTVISTNGNRLANPDFVEQLAASQLGRLILSLDGATEETYRVYRQAGYFNRVIKGIRQLVELRKKMNKKFPRIDLQFLVMRHNEHEMSAIKRLGKELEVDRVIFKSPQIHDFEKADEILPVNPRYQRYFKNNGEYRLKGSYSGYCKKIWYGSVITWDQKVLPCCFDKNADFPLGDLKQITFATIWSDKTYHNFRRGVVSNRNGNEMCRNCTEGLKIFFR